MCSAGNHTPAAPIVLMPIGNRWRGDDAVGPIVRDMLAADLRNCARVRIASNANDAMTILNTWEGASHVLVVDAAVTGAAPGTIHRFDIGVQPIAHESSAYSGHGMGLAEAIELGGALGRLPDRLTGWAIEAGQFESGAALSDAVHKAAIIVADQVRAEITNGLFSEHSNA